MDDLSCRKLLKKISQEFVKFHTQNNEIIKKENKSSEESEKNSKKRKISDNENKNEDITCVEKLSFKTPLEDILYHAQHCTYSGNLFVKKVVLEDGTSNSGVSLVENFKRYIKKLFPKIGYILNFCVFEFFFFEFVWFVLFVCMK